MRPPLLALEYVSKTLVRRFVDWARPMPRRRTAEMPRIFEVRGWRKVGRVRPPKRPGAGWRWALALLLIPTAVQAQRLTIGGASANFGVVSLSPGFLPDPHRVQVVSGGPVVAAEAAAHQCAGWVTTQPDVVLRLSAPSAHLRFFVESSGDTTLIINGPGGRWYCNDDAVGTDPMIDFEGAPAGQYDIWVGSYEPGENHQASLAITELQLEPGGTTSAPPPSPQPLPPPQPPQVITPGQGAPPIWVTPTTPAVPAAGQSYVFQGQVEQLPIQLSGPTIDAIHQACVRTVAASRLRMIDDVTAFGRNAHNGPGYWDTNAACAVVALNARAQGVAPVVMRGTIEAVGYEVAGDPVTVRRVLTTYVPMAMSGDATIDDVTINGRAYHNGPGYWSATEVATMIANQVP